MLFEGEEVEISELTWFQKLIWTPTINKKQRFVVEQVAYGRNTLKDLIDYFGAREDNFKRTIEYLLQKSILIEFGGAYVISEEAIHQEFRQSKGGELLEGYLQRIGRERQEYREEGQLANQRRSEEKIEAALRGELDWYELMMLERTERDLLIEKAGRSST